MAAAGALVLLAAVTGALLRARGVPVHAGAAPLFGRWLPRVGPGTVPALTVAAAVMAAGPRLAARARWGVAVAAAALAGVAWTVCLALVDGTAGLLAPLAAATEYPAAVPRVGSVGSLLRDFVASVPADGADPWPTHVAGHPPGALLVFVWLQRAGLTGPWPPALLCLLAVAVTLPAVAVAAREVCGADRARRMLPFAALLPALIWAGVSFDAVIAAVGAWAIALLAVAGRAGPGRRLPAAVGAGLLGGTALLLSYGAVLLALPALGVLAAAGGRRVRVGALATASALVVVLAPAAGGFAWWEGYLAVRDRYLDGFGGSRPLAYWVWADLAALAVAAGPAVVAGLRRALATRPVPAGARGLAGAALAAVTLAALSGMSKAEVERIWLPWTVWLVVATGWLPERSTRWWLAAQAVTALAVQHLVLTPW